MMLRKNYAMEQCVRTYKVSMFFIRGCFDFSSSTGFYARSGSQTCHSVSLTI